MMATDQDAWECDLAETYRIYDFEQVPLPTLARLSAGLRSNSRIKSRLAGLTVPYDTFLLTRIIDLLQWLQWSRSKAAQDGAQPPEQLAPMMMAGYKSVKTERAELGFDTAEEFEAARRDILTKILRKEGDNA